MKNIETQISLNKYLTKKYNFLSDDIKTISSVYIDRLTKDIICLSCMYGCPVNCLFCKSGENYYRNATSDEIIYMCDFIANINGFSSNKKKVFSFMGSGEPLLNYIPVSDTINHIIKKYNNCSTTVSISGAGMHNFDNFIKRMIVPPKIQLSLHSPHNNERKKIIPSTNNLMVILKILENYGNVELNYVLLNGFNDTRKHAISLSRIVEKYNFNLKINEYHKINDNFIEWLNDYDVYPEIYETDGIDIGAACGQLNSKQYE